MRVIASFFTYYYAFKSAVALIHNPFQIREEPPPYTSPDRSFENPLAGRGSQSFESQEPERASSANSQYGSALYDFSAGGDDEVSWLLVNFQHDFSGFFQGFMH